MKNKPWHMGEVRVGPKPIHGFKNPPKIVKVFDAEEHKEKERLNKIPRRGPPKSRMAIKAKIGRK